MGISYISPDSGSLPLKVHNKKFTDLERLNAMTMTEDGWTITSCWLFSDLHPKVSSSEQNLIR